MKGVVRCIINQNRSINLSDVAQIRTIGDPHKETTASVTSEQTDFRSIKAYMWYNSDCPYILRIP